MPCRYGLSHVGLARCTPGYIYFATYGDFCKIGCTYKSTRFSGVSTRVSSLCRRTGLDFQLTHVLSFQDCIKGLEFALHKEFAQYRIGKDEIFSDAASILDAAALIRSYAGTPVIHDWSKHNDAAHD